MRKFALSMFFLLALTILFTGCDWGAICGDGYCDSTEEFMDNCPQDCNILPPELECIDNVDCEDYDDSTIDYCQDNICVHETMPLCVDSDGMDFFNLGTVSFDGETYTDYCADDYELVEYFCNDGSTDVIDNFVFDCGNNYQRCDEGVCVNSWENCVDDPDDTTSFNVFFGGEKITIDSQDFSGAYSFIADSKEFLVLDSINRVVLAQSENLSADKALFAEGYSDNGMFIVEMDEEPLTVAYDDYKQELLNLKENVMPIQGNYIAVETLNILKQDYVSESRIKKQRITSQKEVIVKDMIRTKAIKSDSDVKEVYTNSFSGFLIETTSDKISEIEKIPGVKKVYPDKKVQAYLDLSVPLIDADDVWNLVDDDGHSLDGTGVTVGVIDTGVDYTHPDLGGCIGSNCKVVGGYDFINHDDDPMDDYGHGTHVAATIAGENDVLMGVAPGAKIYAYKVLGADGSGSNSGVISAIERSMDPNMDGDFSDHLDIISLSLGRWGGTVNDPDAVAIDNAVNAGVIAVVAAGNSGSDYLTLGCPGCAKKAITVAATSDYDELAYFSSRGPTADYFLKPDIAAPGVNICAAQWDSWLDGYHCNGDEDHISISGTSMATPHVSGVAALLLQKNPNLTPDEVKSVLMQTASDLENYDNLETGTGRLNALKAVNYDSIITPSTIELNPGEENWNSFDVTIKNSGTSKGFDISILNPTKFSSNGFESQEFFVTPGFVCVDDNTDENILINLLGVENLSLGMYYGNLVFTERESCNPNSLIVDSKKVPFNFKKIKQYTVVIIGKDFGFENFFKDGHVYLGTNETFVAGFDTGFRTTLNKTFIIDSFVDDGLQFYYSSFILEEFPDRTESFISILGGRWLEENETTIIIDENDAEKIQNNFGTIMHDMNLSKTEQAVNLMLKNQGRDGDPVITGWSAIDDDKCNYWFRNNDSGVYLINDNYIDEIFFTESAKDTGKFPLQSDKWLSLQKVWNPDEGLTYDHDVNAIQQSTLTWDDSFEFNPGLLLSGYNNGYGRSEMLMMMFSWANHLLDSDLPRIIEFNYIPPVNIFFGSIVAYENPEYNYFYGLDQSFNYGALWNIYPPFGEEVNFFESPITMMFEKYQSGKAIVGLFDGADNYNFTDIYGSEYGFISGPYQDFMSYEITLPNEEVLAGVGIPFINCRAPDRSNPVIDDCEYGEYIFKWFAEDFVKNGDTYLEQNFCWQGYYWDSDYETCP